MYKIIGGDQKEYGPVTFEQLAQWIRDNRANAQSLVQKEGGPWVPLGSLPEFAELLAAQAGAPREPGAGIAGSPAPVTPGSLPAYGAPIGPERVREMVQGPATALLVSGIICVILAILSVVANLMGTTFAPAMDEVPQEMRPFVDAMERMQGPMAVISSLIGLAISGLMIYAAQKMRNLESFALVVTATILAMVPCTSPCCCIGLPVGIWVLVVLFKPEVKAAFR